MRDSSSPFDQDGVTDADRIAYVQEVLGELRTVARRIEKSDVLTYFIEMTMMEAADKARAIRRKL